MVINGKEVSVSNSVKILGVTICSDLKCNDHISGCIKKANKRLYFIVLLKRANVPLSDIVNFYCTVIRPVLGYCAPAFHHALPQYLSDDIERVQKRAPVVPPKREHRYNLIQSRAYAMPRTHTARFKNTFIPSMCAYFFRLVCT